MNNQTFVSVILVVKNQSEELIDYLDKLSPYLKKQYSDYEIVIIDQNSNDGIEKKLLKSLATHESIRHIRLSRVVSDDVALAAGIENAIGDFVLNLNIQLDSHKIVSALIDKGLEGHGIVVCVTHKINTITYRYLRKVSTWLLSSIGYSLPNNSTGTFCFSRKAVNAITASGRFYCKLHIRIANVGYSLDSFVCDDFVNVIKKKSIISGMSDTLHHMIFNSTKPLRWMSALGVFGSLMAMLFSLYSLVVNLVNDEVVPGWTTTILFISFLFAILFTMLSFFGEYLARLLDERSEHDEYNVVYERNSSVMFDANRNNILFIAMNDDTEKS